ncbi:MAG TPA: hypothetical protein VH681_05730 [Nitrospiraceae bacterium]|jgi:hypothetical protein
MEKTATKKILSVAVATAAVVALTAAPAIAKSSKKPASHSSAAAAASSLGTTAPQLQDAPKSGQHDSKPGPAWKTVGGIVKKIEGDAYMVEDYEGNQVKLYVGQGTKQIRKKQVGDTVRAEITRGGFANSIQ